MAVTADYLHSFIDEQPDQGIYRVHRSMFTDEDLFELEMRHIFEGGWVFMAHESQLPDPFDFITGHIGRQPVIINRDKAGGLQGFINACQHRGAQIERMSRGNRKLFTCPFHGWCYRANGELASCGDSDNTRYTEQFDKQALGLPRIPQVADYRGFIFASLNADVPPLDQHLGQAARCIDHIVDQHPEGKLEVLPGKQFYTFEGNWKLQAENGVDGYHVGTIHANYVQTIANRKKIRAEQDGVKPMDVGSLGGELPNGFYAFENGHVMLWNEWTNPQARSAYPLLPELTERYGPTIAKWMTGYMRNMLIYPNVFLMDQMSSQIRMFRPLSVNRTQVTSMCFAPVDEDPAMRTHRIRQFEDFFNASGMATPDDLAAFNASQAGFEARQVEWNDLSRGAASQVEGPDALARELGLRPLYCGTNLEDEGIYLNQHRRWLEMLEAGLERDAHQAAAAGGQRHVA
ncbi:MAG: benzoate 1,2-dioxygenase large subunit [Salinisphaeraceae bacterium]|nr:benzoate 1,2-dioxygenase large subunit [Salinisphaeraceae bacterium]